MTALLWVALPYLCLAVFAVGHVWRWKHDQMGWTTHTSQLLENRILRWGSPLFHLGAFGVIGGHVIGLLVPASLTRALGVPEHLYHLAAVWGGALTGTMLVVGLALLIARRFVSGRLRRRTTAMDRVLYAALATMVGLGMVATVGTNLLGSGYDYRETIAVWFRGIFWFQPDSSLMAHAPLVYQLHALGGFLFLALWPFTRLVHVWSAPVAYLWRPYVVYRARRVAATKGAPVMTTTSSAPEAAVPRFDQRRAPVMLALAALGFALNFWAWALLSPLAPGLKESLHLTAFQQALVVAVPVVVGSVGRIPVGAVTDRFGGRVMFPIISAATILPVLFLGFLGLDSLGAVLDGGFFLGIGGTAFAIGVPFVSAWFPPERRGLALGIFGAGMGGTAISALTTVKLTANVDRTAPFLITAAALAAYAAVAALVLRDAPGRPVPTASLRTKMARAGALRITWQASVLYAIGFGGYVAFSVYLPTYLKSEYGLSQADAANKMAGFVLLAVLMRPLGGWLSDRIGPVVVLGGAFATVTAGAALQTAAPGLAPLGTIAFLAMAAALGTASGAVFALVALRAPADQVGAVTGIVGAAGGLGGFVPPLVMGALYGAVGSYALGLAALAMVAAAMVLLDLTVVRRSGRSVVEPMVRQARPEGSARSN